MKPVFFVHHMCSRIGLFVFAAILVLSPLAFASEFSFRDLFPGTKDAAWDFYVPLAGPTESFDPPGFWTLNMPTTSTVFDHWSTVNNAPALYVDIPSANQADNFFIETHLVWGGPTSGNFHGVLVVYFSAMNCLYWGPYIGTNLRMEKSGINGIIDSTYSTNDVYLRIERTGTSYAFLYTSDPDLGWTTGGTYTSTETPTRVGVMGKTWGTLSANLSLSFDYFLMNATMGASAGSDQRVYGGDRVTLNGSGPPDATSFVWQQIAGTPTVTLEPSPNQAVVEFDAPELEVGALLTFRLSVDAPSTEGVTTDEVNIIVTAINPPKLPPSNIHVLPLDAGAAGLGFRTVWDPLIDAVQYEIGYKVGDTVLWLETISTTSYEVKGLTEGQTRTIAVRGRNKFGGSEDPAAIAEVTHIGVRNLARPASQGGTSEPTDYVFAVSHYAIAGMNNVSYTDTNDSWNGVYKAEDYWGYLWGSDLFFDHVVYFTGNMFFDGGWWTDLKVQYTKDGGTSWLDVPIFDIYPEMPFTNERAGKQPFTRYDLTIPTLRGNGLRIAGTPGGSATFTSMSELEVFGNQTQGPLIAQGVDAEYPEGATAFLDGSLSFSTAGPITSYQWTGPGGITITDPTNAIASFQAPIVSEDTVYVFSLEASDGVNTDTDDDVRILVTNLVTTAIAGPNRAVPDGSDVTLDGSASLTTTGTLTYLWTQTAGTDVGVTGNTNAIATFTAPVLWDHAEKLTFRLQVNDGAGGVSSDEVVITARNSLIGSVFDPAPFDPTDWRLQGSANFDNVPGILEITPTQYSLAGSAFLNYTIDCSRFLARFKLYIGDGDGADGMVFGWLRGPWLMGGAGGSLGWYGGGLQGYGIVFDTYPQTYWNLVSFENPQIHTVGDTRGYASYEPPIDLENAGWFDVEVEMDNGHLQVWMTNEASGMPRTLAIDYTLAGYTGFPAYFGFTGATGGLMNNHWIDELPLVLKDAYGARNLPAGSYQTGVPVPVDVSLRVNPASTPTSVEVVEQIPPGLSASDVSAPGATVSGGQIRWTLSGTNVKPQTLSYTVTPPEGITDALAFSGTVSFPGESSGILGDSAMYPVPTAPRSLSVEMLQAAHLSWSAPLTAGTASYNIYRSVNGGAYEFLASTTSTTYTDKWVVAGDTYAYEVSAVNVLNDEGALSRPTAQVSIPAMDVRESEDFNYGGGQYPGSAGCPAANEAPTATDLDAQYDLFHPNTGGPNEYRPANVTPDGVGIETVEEADDPGVFHTNIGWVDVGSWYRYTYNVPEAGWIKLEFRVAAPSGGTLAAYWDEALIGTVSYNTGNWHIFNWYLMEDQIQTTAGVHTLRIESIAGGVNFDKHAIQWNAAPPARKTIWDDDFESYSTSADVFSPTNGGWTRGNTTNTAGSWTLWDTGTSLGSESGDIPAMEGNYMVADSDLSGAGTLLDEEMLSPEVDCDGWTKLRLNYNYNYRIYDDPDHTQDAEVDVRVFDSATGWSGWTNLFHLDTSDVPPALDPPMLSGTQVYDLSVYDGKKIQLKFHFFNAEYDYWFAFDNVAVTGVQEAVEIPLPDIALAAGNVTVSWDAFAGQYTVEYTADLKGTWTPIAGPITLTSFTEVMRADRTGYYRIVGQ